MEQWKAVVGYEGLYEVSSLGRVKSCSKHRGTNYKQLIEARFMQAQQSKGGYLHLNLAKVKQKKKCWVHRLVAECFLTNPLQLPEVNHIDGNKQNNSAENLEWCSRLQNEKHAYRTGLKKANKHG